MKIYRSISLVGLLLGLICSTIQAQTNVDIVISGGTVVTMNKRYDVIPNGVIAIDQGKIVYVGAGDKAPAFSGKKIRADGKIVIPGMINAHTHIPMTLLRGLADDLELFTWLTQYIWPAERANVSSDFVKWGTLLGCLEMIQTGTTTFVDMYFFEDEIARATDQCGLRAILGETFIDFPTPDNSLPTLNERWENSLTMTRKFIQAWKQHPRITPAVAPHAPYSVLPEYLQGSMQLAKSENVPWLIHLAETNVEMVNTQQHLASYGQANTNTASAENTTPVQYLNNLGVLNDRVIAAHAIWTDKEDLSILAQHHVGVAHCPQSNMKLATGRTADVIGMLSKGIPVALGTDGPASNNDLILWEEMSEAALLHKFVAVDAKAMPARQAFAMATILGAQAIHMDHKIGSLETGKQADIAIVNSSTHQIPYRDENIYSRLVYATKGSDVVTTIVDGKILMKNRKIRHLNLEEIFEHAEELRNKVLEGLNRK